MMYDIPARAPRRRDARRAIPAPAIHPIDCPCDRCAPAALADGDAHTWIGIAAGLATAAVLIAIAEIIRLFVPHFLEF